MRSIIIPLLILIALYAVHIYVLKIFSIDSQYSLLNTPFIKKPFIVGDQASSLLKENTNKPTPKPLDNNPAISQVLSSMDYIIDYNSKLYSQLYTTVDTMLLTYYQILNNHSGTQLDDLSYHYTQYQDILTEITLALPFRYHSQLNTHVDSLNLLFDKKIDLLKFKSSKNPIKISLMNYKST
jgi:hypothetical protein